MQIELFQKKIINLIQHDSLPTNHRNAFNSFNLESPNEIYKTSELGRALFMTRLSIIFEGLYQSIKNYSTFKMQLKSVRKERWSENYGLPPLTFLLTFQNEIEQISNLINNSQQNSLALSSIWHTLANH